MDEFHFDIYAGSKSLRDRKLIKNCFKKRAIFASELKRTETTIFFSQNRNGLCDRICLIFQEKIYLI